MKLLAPTFFARQKNLLEVADGGRVLVDVGAGAGENCRLLSKRFQRVVGIDYNRWELGVYADSPANVLLVNGDASRLPVADKAADWVTCLEVLEHLPDDEAAVREIARITKAGGFAVVSVPDARYPLLFDPINWFLERLFARHVGIGIWGFGHVRLYRAEELQALLERHGFRVRETRHLTHWLAGGIEGYWSTLLQRFVKVDAKNLGRKGKRIKPLNAPKPLLALTAFVCWLDDLLFRGSKTSIGLMVLAEKVQR